LTATALTARMTSRSVTSWDLGMRMVSSAQGSLL
jgi:hypothetical protein